MNNKEAEKFEKLLQSRLNELPYTKHLDDGQYNDGQLYGFECGAYWAKTICISDFKASLIQAFEKESKRRDEGIFLINEIIELINETKPL